MGITCSIPLGPLGPVQLRLHDFLGGGSNPMDLIYPRRALEKYGRDMTAAAVVKNKTTDDSDPVTIVGRDSEIDRVICTLCRRSKNSTVLVGAPGVGKTAIAEGLAQRVAAGTVPPPLAGARVVALDLGALQLQLAAGTTKCLGTYEERVEKVIQEAEAADGKVILFIDEMQHVLKDPAAADVLKPALARGRLRCVGATTLDGYRRYIEKDAALDRRFQRIDVEEPSADVAIGILQGLKRRYEALHGLKVMDSAIVAAVQLAARYIPGRQFPDKAIDLIDEACATTRMQVAAKQKKLNSSTQAKVVVCPEHVAQVVSRWSGIPVHALDHEEKEKLMHLADRLHERVVGQDEAVNSVAQAVLRARIGLDKCGRQPIGCFLFLGSTGVGKTELAKALAEQLFDSEKMLIRFDMSEFVGASSVLRLIGAPPSYVGHEDGGQLTEKVRRHPYSVILFDEVEKADPSVFNAILQLLDDGVLTDGKGRTVDFKNTLVIMTSNLGSEHMAEGMMRGEETMEAARGLVMKHVQEFFKAEFLNRLSDVVIFEPLSRDKLKEVVKIQMKSIIGSVADKGISLFVSNAAMDVIFLESYCPMYGARPIRRWVQKNVLTRLSEMVINGQVDEGSTIYVDATEDRKALRYEATKMKQDETQDALEIATDDSDEEDDRVLEVATIAAGRSPSRGHWHHFHFLSSLPYFALLGFAVLLKTRRR